MRRWSLARANIVALADHLCPRARRPVAVCPMTRSKPSLRLRSSTGLSPYAGPSESLETTRTPEPRVQRGAARHRDVDAVVEAAVVAAARVGGVVRRDRAAERDHDPVRAVEPRRRVAGLVLRVEHPARVGGRRRRQAVSSRHQRDGSRPSSRRPRRMRHQPNAAQSANSPGARLRSTQNSLPSGSTITTQARLALADVDAPRAERLEPGDLLGLGACRSARRRGAAGSSPTLRLGHRARR